MSGDFALWLAFVNFGAILWRARRGGRTEALADAAYNGTRMTVLILDNATTAMTGGQAHPAACRGS